MTLLYQRGLFKKIHFRFIVEHNWTYNQIHLRNIFNKFEKHISQTKIVYVHFLKWLCFIGFSSPCSTISQLHIGGKLLTKNIT